MQTRVVRWVDGKRVIVDIDVPDRVVPAEEVKAEARRRIESEWPILTQLNTLTAAVDTALNSDERKAVAAMKARIGEILSASDAIEGMDNIPGDYESDHHWPDKLISGD